MSQLHSPGSETSARNANDTQLLPTQVFHDWLAKQGAPGEARSENIYTSTKSPIVSSVGSSLGSRSDDGNADVVSSDDDRVDRSAHITEEITSPATFLSPNTPYIKGQAQDTGASAAHKIQPSPSETLSNWFGSKAANTVAGLSQIFYQTQAPTSPVQDVYQGEIRPNKRRKLSTSPPSSPFLMGADLPPQSIGSTIQAPPHATSRQGVTTRPNTNSNISATPLRYERCADDTSPAHECQLLGDASHQLNIDDPTQTINVADSQQESFKLTSLPSNGLFHSQGLQEPILSSTHLRQKSRVATHGQQNVSQNTSSISPPHSTSSPYENNVRPLVYQEAPSAHSIPPLAQSPNKSVTIKSTTSDRLVDSLTPPSRTHAHLSRSVRKAKARRSTGDRETTHEISKSQMLRESPYKRGSDPLNEFAETPKLLRSQLRSSGWGNIGITTREAVASRPFYGKTTSSLPGRDGGANRGNNLSSTNNSKKNPRRRKLNAKLNEDETTDEISGDATALEPIAIKTQATPFSLNKVLGSGDDVAATGSLDNLNGVIEPRDPSTSVQTQSRLSGDSMNRQHVPFAPYRVFAWFGGKDRAAYYPGSVTPEQCDDFTLLRVAFDDGNSAEVKSHLVLSLRFEIGDLVKVDKIHCRAHKFVVRGFEDCLEREASASVPARPSDVHGYQTIVLERKSSRDSKDSKTGAAQERIPISNLYISGDLLKHYVDRAWSCTNPLSNVNYIRHETSRPDGAQPLFHIPSSRFRRHTTTLSGTNLPGISTGTTVRLDGLFSNMVFGITYMGENSAEKARISNLIRAHGGHILAGGFDELFETARVPRSPSMDTQKEGTCTGNELELLPWAASLKFSALITDHYSRKAKYMQALALNFPCLSGRWITECVHQKQIVRWDRYLLPAGESVALSGAVKSRTALKYDDIYTSTLRGMIDSRPKLLQGQEILIVGKMEARRQAHLFLTQALAPRRVFQVLDLESAQQVLNNDRLVIQWIYVYDGNVSKAKKLLDRQNVVGDEFVMQSLILGALLESH